MSEIRGHFFAILVERGDIMVPTTLTNVRKRTGTEKENRKRLELSQEIGVELVAKRFDNVVRRWQGVKSNGPDGDG